MIQSRASERANQIESNRIKAIDRRDATRPTDRPNPTDRRPTTDRPTSTGRSVRLSRHSFIHSFTHPSIRVVIHPSIQPTTGRVGRHRPRRASDTDGWMAFVCVFLCRVCAYLRTVVRTYSTVRGSARPVVTQKNASATGRDSTRRDSIEDATEGVETDATRREPPRVESESNE